MLLKLSFACPCSEGSRCWSNGLPTHPCLPSQWKRDTIPLWKTSALTATSQWRSQTCFFAQWFDVYADQKSTWATGIPTWWCIENLYNTLTSVGTGHTVPTWENLWQEQWCQSFHQGTLPWILGKILRCQIKTYHLHACAINYYMFMNHVDFISHQSFCQHHSSYQNYTSQDNRGCHIPRPGNPEIVDVQLLDPFLGCGSVQAPNNPKAKMFKVLKEVIEDSSTGTRSESGDTRLYILVQIKVATCGDLWFCPKMISIMFPTWLIKTRYVMSWTLLMGFQMFFLQHYRLEKWRPWTYLHTTSFTCQSNEFHTLSAQVSLSGRVRDAAGKALLAKQLGDLNTNVPQFDLKTGAIRSKKAKKEKSPVEQAVGDLKTLEKKLLNQNFVLLLSFTNSSDDMPWWWIKNTVYDLFFPKSVFVLGPWMERPSFN